MTQTTIAPTILSPDAYQDIGPISDIDVPHHVQPPALPAPSFPAAVTPTECPLRQDVLLDRGDRNLSVSKGRIKGTL